MAPSRRTCRVSPSGWPTPRPCAAVRLRLLVTLGLPVAACAGGRGEELSPPAAFEAAVSCVEDRMQARGADYLGRRVHENQVDVLFDYRGVQMAFMVRGRRTEDVTVSVRRQFEGRRLDVQMMQIADAVVKQCSPQPQDT